MGINPQIYAHLVYDVSELVGRRRCGLHCESFARKEEEIRRMGRRYFRFNVLPHHALVITYENNRVICVHQ